MLDKARFFARVTLMLAALVVAPIVAGCGGDESNPTTSETQTQVTTPPPEPPLPTTNEPPRPTVVRVSVRGGVPAGGIVRRTVDQGERVVLVVRSDVADEVHVHGYDISRDVPAGGRARIAFRATIPGRFEVELEHRGVPIAELTVTR